MINLDMNESDEHTQKILDAVFDEYISEILAEMENSPKKCEFLTEKFEITPDDLDEKLSFLMQHEFVGSTNIIINALILNYYYCNVITRPPSRPHNNKRITNIS